MQELACLFQSPVCYRNLRAAATNLEHNSVMKLLYCGHPFCGDCAATMKRQEDQRRTMCSTSARSQIAAAVPAEHGAESEPRPKRDADSLSPGGTEDDQQVPVVHADALITRYRGDRHVRSATRTSGATVAKHRRLLTKQV